MVSKAVAFKATQNHFVSYFFRKKVDLTRSGLQAFVQVTSKSARLGCRVRHLTLTGVDLEYSISELEKINSSGEVITDTAIGMNRIQKRRACRREELDALESSLEQSKQWQADDDDFHKQGLDVSLISEALRNIASHNGHTIETLRLEIVARIDGIANRRRAGALEIQRRAFGLRSAARAFAVLASSLRDDGPTIQRLSLIHI